MRKDSDTQSALSRLVDGHEESRVVQEGDRLGDMSIESTEQTKIDEKRGIKGTCKEGEARAAETRANRNGRDNERESGEGGWKRARKDGRERHRRKQVEVQTNT